jgi:hypothetical protein
VNGTTPYLLTSRTWMTFTHDQLDVCVAGAANGQLSGAVNANFSWTWVDVAGVITTWSSDVNGAGTTEGLIVNGGTCSPEVMTVVIELVLAK